MNLVCARCLREGMAPPTYGTDRRTPADPRSNPPARPAVTATNGEAVCLEHLDL